ncbi:PLP-dependent aminotransferase family protein [Terrimonas sp. NA20]|uniref:PLP-dependent aminotransferase family protein n=1 Tax=Terrimonas ginsenosidimutans TaxID=2908004 RepID=A0ABS9KLW9_9BACT|nr:PLP-dependent aminotransferase family protein [Terrimonas ginsenosidimutans]MCG2613260.1 PLP-dependent aminotransferase family protein [Terrimonas ginsenosidimutans]
MLRPWKLSITIDPKAGKAVYLQIADAIISDIQSGRLKPGDALPGSRTLAHDLGLNRNTIVEALNVLLNEEWLVSNERKGTFVANTLPSQTRKRKADIQPASVTEPVSPVRISIDDGHPDSRIAPVDELARAYRQIFKQKARWQMMGYGDAMGSPGFRKAIVNMLNQQRGMQTNEQLVCITRGSQMAMYLAAHVLIDEGDYVMVEHPGYKPAWKAFEKAGAKLLAVRLDDEGLLIDDVLLHLNSGKKIKAIYTTPHHQYPTTVTLSLQRRMQLIQLSNQHGFTIIEDDYDNEFHFGYRPVLPLSSFSELKNYIYIGTMSKVVAASLRIGYLSGNDKKLIEKAASLRQLIDVQSDAIMEQAILQLIEDGTIKRHLKKATTYYRNKRELTETLLNKHLSNKVSFRTPDGGLAFWIEPYAKVNWEDIALKLQKKGIRIITPASYSLAKPVNGFRFGYGSLTEKQLEEGIKALATLL